MIILDSGKRVLLVWCELNLNTHFLFAAAAAAIVSGRPEAIMLAGLGSVIPDLDRPYWFIPRKRIEEEEYHRALLHNFVVLALAYLVNPYFGLGLFSHLMLDNMTTVKDRGVEWLFPFRRMIPRDYWSQAEVQREPVAWVPWRRTYGPALNGHMLDTYVFLTSIGALLLWFLFQSLHHPILNLADWVNAGFITAAGAVSLLFLSGEYCLMWPNWSRVKRIMGISLLAAISVGVALGADFLLSQGLIFSWSEIQSDWFLSTSDLFGRLLFVSVTAYALIILAFIRAISLYLSNSLPALCTKMRPRDFIMDEKTGDPDVFV